MSEERKTVRVQHPVIQTQGRAAYLAVPIDVPTAAEMGSIGLAGVFASLFTGFGPEAGTVPGSPEPVAPVPAPPNPAPGVPAPLMRVGVVLAAGLAL